MHDEDLFEKDGGLLQLLVPSMEAKKLLLIESISYLPRLREMFPHAKITAVVADEWRIEAYKDVGDIQWELMDYREVGGSMVIGIGKPVIKAHGSSDARAVRGAIKQAIGAVESGFCDDIRANVAAMTLPREGTAHAEEA